MRALTPREKRTIRVAGGLLAVYLVLVYGVRGWRYLEARRAERDDMTLAIRGLESDILLKKEMAAAVLRLRESLRLDLAKLRRDTVVAESLSAIQEAARARSVGLGATNEVRGSSSSRELARFQLQGKATVRDATRFLHDIGHLGYPLAIDHLVFKTSSKTPGELELNVSIVLLDFEVWKNREETRA